MSDIKEKIAKTVGGFFKEGDVVNLGIGVPMLVSKYVVDGVLLHTENGLLAYGPAPEQGTEDQDLVGAGGQFLTLRPEASAFDHATSYCIIRGGHLTATVLGALEVDGHGNLANWSLPNRVMGMGGAMDLVVGARSVIVVTEHCNSKTGQSKILKQCKLPLTGAKVVTTIVTEYCVLDYDREKDHLVVRAMDPEITKEQLQAKTEAELIFPAQIGKM